MIFNGLDGKKYKVNLAKYNKGKKFPSGLHDKAGDLLHSLFPCFQILEEVRCMGSKSYGGTDLFLDFLVLELEIAVEVHGEQHFKYTPYFHRSKQDFLKQQRRDKVKQNWCNLNGLTLKILRYDNESDWQRILTAD